MRQQALRVRTGARYLLTAAMCAVTATACGSAAASGTGSTAAGTGAATAAIPKVSLDITVTSHPGAKPVHWTLRCDPAGGTHPDPAQACRVLLAAKDPFAPRSKHIECPMILAGTKMATVKGTWFGKKVDSVLADGGCTMAIWTKVGQIFN